MTLAWALRTGSFSRAIVTMALLACGGLSDAKAAQPSERHGEKVTKVQITIDGKQITSTFEDSATARAFLSMLPMTLTLKDYNNTEKVSDLPRRLSTEGAPAGLDPKVGDITYYAPWGSLAIFYRDFGYSRGLVRLGRIDSGIELLRHTGPITITLERAD